MVAEHHGHRLTLPELRRKVAISLKGTTLKSLMAIADTLGFSTRPLRLDLDALPQLKTPAILHWDMAHYVVLVRTTPRYVEINDPAIGKRRLSWAEVSKHFTGVALELTPAPGFQKKTHVEKVRLSDLWTRARGFVPSMVQLLILSLVLQVFTLLSPMLNQMVIDDAVTKGDMDLLGILILILGMGLLALAQMGTSLLRGFVSMHFGTHLSFQMRGNLLRHLLRLPVPWFEKRSLGDILSRFGSLGPVQGLFTGGLIGVVLDGLMAVVTLVVMLVYAPLLTGIVIAGLVIYFGVRAASYPYQRRLADEGIQLSAKENSVFLETVRGARAFKLFGREAERHSLWQNAWADSINNGLKAQKFGLFGGTANGLFDLAENLLVLWLGARMVIAGDMTLGMLFAFQSYRSQFTGAVVALVNQFFSFRMLGLHLERLADVVHQEVEDEGAVPAAATPPQGGVGVRGLSLRYADHEPWVLKDVELAIEPGEFVAFVGPSGGGKSTLLKILMGLYPPSEGEVLIDGRPLRGFGLARYRAGIGVVMQDDQLFAGTLADNIAFFDPEIDMEQVEEVAKAAQVHEDIMRMPMGYMTLAGDLGSTLSGGQRQRVLLARALYRRPALLFLDEGTANLDAVAENAVMEVVRGLPITRIVVAHRPAAIAGAGRVFVVNGGTVRQAVSAVPSGATAS